MQKTICALILIIAGEGSKKYNRVGIAWRGEIGRINIQLLYSVKIIVSFPLGMRCSVENELPPQFW